MATADPPHRHQRAGTIPPVYHGTWNGIFYPPSRAAAARSGLRRAVVLCFEHFNTVEVNSTFYGQPRADVCRAWAERTPAAFEFSAKLYRKFTHPKMVEHEPANPFDLDDFKRGIDPLASAGKLGALLAQFPPSFKSDPASLDYLQWLLHEFAGYSVAVELRHASWSDALGDTLQLLNAYGAALVQIDEPKFRFSIAQNQLPNIQGIYYMRLHGRNAAQWWNHEKPEDRYNYLYSPQEVTEFVETIDAAKEIVKKVSPAFPNNHYSAKSVANAAMIKQQLGEPIEGEVSLEEFSLRYPELAGEAKPVLQPF